MLAEGKIMEYNRFGIGVFGGSSFTTHSITAVGELHTHDFFELSYVIRGSVKHRTENHVEYLTNDCFIILLKKDTVTHYRDKVPLSVNRLHLFRGNTCKKYHIVVYSIK